MLKKNKREKVGRLRYIFS